MSRVITHSEAVKWERDAQRTRDKEQLRKNELDKASRKWFEVNIIQKRRDK